MFPRSVATSLRQLCTSVSREGVVATAIAAVKETTPESQIASEAAVEKPPENPSYIPWTPTEKLQKKKHYFKRMAFLVDTLEKEQEAIVRAKREIPEFDKGDILQLKLRVPENMSKEVEFTGLCIAKKNKSYRSSFTLRKTWPPSAGMERTFPLYSPTILEIKVTGHKEYKKRKLYYLRETAKATAV